MAAVACGTAGAVRGYYAALARIGGDGRVRLLLKIAKMDEDGDGSISGDECVLQGLEHASTVCSR